MMKRLLLSVAMLTLVSGTGCKLLPQRCTNCQQTLHNQQASAVGQMGYQQAPQVMQAASVLQQPGPMPAQAMPAQAVGPPTAAYSYPYYTTRGPRDFLMKNPPSIGP